jgi:SAM-dependent methyltransferase
MTDWALSLLPVSDSRLILDIGCGGGAALKKLSDLAPRALLQGLDYSMDSLRVAIRTNKRLIGLDRLLVCRANVSHLPYDSGLFDLAVAIESHYFWPYLKENLQEIRRVLRPGGAVLLAGGQYFGGKRDGLSRRLAANDRMNCQTLHELHDTPCEAGYANVAVREEWNKGWFFAMGRERPAKTRSEDNDGKRKEDKEGAQE